MAAMSVKLLSCTTLIAAIVLWPMGAPAQAQAPAQPTPSGPARVSCTVRTSALSPGESAFAQHHFAQAESLLREEGKAPGVDGERSRNALVRVLLREDKLDDATKEAEGWLGSAPNDGWAKMSIAEVEWRKGEVDQAPRDIDVANASLPCNAQIRADYAKVFEFSGLDATAKHALDVAHKLDPMDEEITSDWLALQPRTVRLESLTTYLATSSSLPAGERSSLERERSRLANPASSTSCHVVSSATSTSIPYRSIQNGAHAAVYWGLSVSFNGVPRRLEIDTGAHGLVLTRAAATALHLAVEERGSAGGFGDQGNVATQVSTVKSIKIGSLEFQDCRVEVLEKDPEMGSGDGLIGGDVFADYLLTLDFPGHVLRLDQLPALPGSTAGANTPSLVTDGSENDAAVRDRYVDPSMQDWAKVFRSGHFLILPVRLNNGPVRLFVMDSGAESNLISAQVAKQVGTLYKGSEFSVTGISGEVKKTYTTGPLKLDFAGLSYPSPGMTAIDTEKFGVGTGVAIAGFIGAPMLHQLTVQIDYRDNLVHFSFDPKRLLRCAERVNLSDCY